MSPEAHDRAAAEISHLPQALACLLMLLPKHEHLKIAASGFRDMTRLAGSDAQMWRDIFLMNREPVLRVLAEYQRALERLAAAIRDDDGEGLAARLLQARVAREELVHRS